MALDLMYDTFFCEFPLGRLSEWDEFMQDHPTINTFAEFDAHYARILDAFHNHNFVEQYARECREDADYRPDHTTTAQCETNLDSLRRWIYTVGPRTATAQLDNICWQHRAYDWSTLAPNSRSPLQEDVMALLTQYVRTPMANICVNMPNRGHRTLVRTQARLPGLLQGLHECS
jgi:hypothetical protein